MGTFITGGSDLPAAKSDGQAPGPWQTATNSVYAADWNVHRGALLDVRDHTSGWVNVKSYGATGDGTTDDTAAVQEAIDAALAKARPPPLVLCGRHKITSPLIVDRLVDTTLSEFRIVGAGDGAGLYATSEINLFDSTLPVTTSPQSEAIVFEGVHFEGQAPENLVNVLAGNKFLRIRFVNCNFRQVRLMQSSTVYAQTFHFIGGNIRGWNGVFLSAPGSYDVSMIGVTAEAGGTGATLINSVGTAPTGAHPTAGLRLIGNVIEGLPGSVLKTTGAVGVSIVGNYFEANGSVAEPAFNFYGGAYVNKAINVSGNFFGATAAGGWEFYWGPSEGVTSSANHVYAGGLHDEGDNLSRIESKGDVASAGVFRLGRPPGDAAVGADRGDADAALTVRGDAPIQCWATTLTANRAVTLATNGAKNGDRFRVVRTGLGAFTLDVGGLKTIPSATAAYVDVAFNGAAWVLTGYGAL